MSRLAELQATLPAIGRVDWIGLRSRRRGPVLTAAEATAVAGGGLLGDRYRGGGGRGVTLIQAEHLPVIAACQGLRAVSPEALRRNLVVSGINLAALKGRRFRVGKCRLEHTGACHPCSRMEEALGRGGYNAVRGHGGITARVLEGGTLRIGDPVWADD